MKTKILKYALLLPIAGLLLTGCKEHIVNKFESDASLYFLRGAVNSKGAIQRDSITYSFFLFDWKTEDIVWVDVKLTGPLSDHDRALSIVQTNAGEKGAAVAGRDYVALDDPSMLDKLVMPAGSTTAAIPITIKRTAAMETEVYRLDLAIVPNENFVEGITSTVGGPIFTVKMTSMASQPPMWENTTSNGYFITFGVWGQKKMRFILDYVGYTAFDELLNNTDLYRFYNLKAREALAEYLLNNPPLVEADETVVEFPRY